MLTYAYKLLEGYIKIVNTGYIWGVKNEEKHLFSIQTLL